MMKPNEAIKVQELFSIKGKTALVTGGSRGIGLMIARGYVEAGAKVYISSRKKEVCDETARQLSEIGECISIPADLSTTEGCKLLADEVKARESALDILVNNAGASWGAPLAEYPEAGWDKVMDTNLKGIFFLTQMLVPLLEKAGRHGDPARVINIGSIDGIKVPRVENYAYAPSKAAVHHLTRVLAVKLGERNITVNAVAPGPFESKMMEWTLEQFRAQIEANCPLKRIGAPGDMAGVAIYLASRAGAYVNGAVIPADGGICIK
ncbi:MAG: SDR family oxidoreductase [Blastocatellia bacterium]